jgi:DNA polymerase-1
MPPILPSFNASSPLILVDGSSYLFRAFHAMPPLTNGEGHPTGAIFGVINMIGKLLEQYQPEHIAIIFDAKGKTFRNDMYADYKAHRPPMPDDLRVQIEPIHQIVKALGLPLLVIEGVEADDVMGTLAHQATQHKMEALLSTGDKDMAQLVNEHITLINTMNDTLMTPETVLEKFGVKPAQMIDYLALVGDTADNIPGIPKCGPKTAAKWLQAFGNIDNLVGNAPMITGKIGEYLRANLEQLALSRQLTTIRLDCDLPVKAEDIKRQPADVDALAELFQRYDLKNWHQKVLSGELPFSKTTGRKAHSQTLTTAKSQADPIVASESATVNAATYETLFTWAEFDTWLTRLEQAEHFAIDTETTGLNTQTDLIVGISFAVAEKGHILAAYLPLIHDYDGAPQQLPKAEVLARLKPLLENTRPQKIGQNLKYDWHIFQNEGIHLQGIAFDTLLESYCYNSVATRHNKDDFALN